MALADMLKAKDGDFFISAWLRNRNTVEFLGTWESVHNPKFNSGEFAIIMHFASKGTLFDIRTVRCSNGSLYNC